MKHVWKLIDDSFQIQRYRCACGLVKINHKGDRPYTRYRGATGVEIERAGPCAPAPVLR